MFWGFGKYRRQVRNDMSYLLGFGTEDCFLEGMLSGGRGISLVIRDQFRAGKSSMQCAFHVLHILLGKLILTDLPAERWSETEAFLTGQSKQEPKYVIERVLKKFFAQMYVQRDLGRIDEIESQIAVHEIIGTLRGLTPGERQGQRLASALRRSTA